MLIGREKSLLTLHHMFHPGSRAVAQNAIECLHPGFRAACTDSCTPLRRDDRQHSTSGSEQPDAMFHSGTVDYSSAIQSLRAVNC